MGRIDLSGHVTTDTTTLTPAFSRNGASNANRSKYIIKQIVAVLFPFCLLSIRFGLSQKFVMIV